MDKVLEVEKLNHVFNKGKKTEVYALHNVSFDLYKGECLGIIGESGSGKSTTARIVARLIPYTSGNVVLQGENMNNIPRKELYKKIQMIFQTPVESFNPRIKIGDSVAESLRNAGYSKSEAKKRVEILLEECGLKKEFYNRYPHEISGGQCQRAAIARALAIKPKILICDEATSALDVTVQKEIINLLNNIRKNRGDDISILFISHDIALVQQFCNRVVVMNKGEIVEMGETNEVITNPKNNYTKKLIASIL
ncbi:MAG: ABC transporter ATP-binding protein [Lachnospiraceae bacterium]|nr:ABC transporter ATP-binding protein [Lachnospiraceae bacterium]